MYILFVVIVNFEQAMENLEGSVANYLIVVVNSARAVANSSPTVSNLAKLWQI